MQHFKAFHYIPPKRIRSAVAATTQHQLKKHSSSSWVHLNNQRASLSSPLLGCQDQREGKKHTINVKGAKNEVRSVWPSTPLKHQGNVYALTGKKDLRESGVSVWPEEFADTRHSQNCWNVGSAFRLLNLGEKLASPSKRLILPALVWKRQLHTNSRLAASSTTLGKPQQFVAQEPAKDMRNQIYCDASPGSLLAVIQTAHLFPDCKHFVDMPLRKDAATTLAAWRELVSENGGKIEPQILMQFINEHFEEPGNELEDHIPEDFSTEPDFDFIADPHYRTFAKELHLKWPTLSRRVKDQVQKNPENYSLIALPNPFIVPGGRFRELYYWDSFWTIKGLLSSRMYKMAKGMIENMAHLVDVYGFIPNGNRIYYLNRSQPPLLTWCVDAYFQATQDLEFVAKIMPLLEKEMDYFMKNKLINQCGWKSHLFQFRVQATGPRPESYREDFEAAEHIEDLLMKQQLWGDIAAAAESGRDFSARWFGNEGVAAGKMGSTRTSAIIPVELNAIICGNLRIFSQFYNLLGQVEKSQIAYGQYQLMREAIHQVFWNEQHGCWFDFDVTKNAQIEVFFDTNLFPLFAGCVHDDLDGNRIVQYLQNNGILNYGGIPTSLINSGQQWDWPSSWAPMNWMVIVGLKSIGQIEVAKTLAAKWISKNYLIWLHSGTMYEKYNIASDCFKARGGGGEYDLQEGFGWTNGVILDLLKEFANDLVYDIQSRENVKCECCRPQVLPTQNTTMTGPTDSIISQLSLPTDLPIDQPTVEQQALAVAAALAAELAQNTPTAVINDGATLIKAA